MFDPFSITQWDEFQVCKHFASPSSITAEKAMTWPCLINRSSSPAVEIHWTKCIWTVFLMQYTDWMACQTFLTPEFSCSHQQMMGLKLDDHEWVFVLALKEVFSDGTLRCILPGSISWRNPIRVHPAIQLSPCCVSHICRTPVCSKSTNTHFNSQHLGITRTWYKSIASSLPLNKCFWC